MSEITDLNEAVAVLNRARWLNRAYRIDGDSIYQQKPPSNHWHELDPENVLAIANYLVSRVELERLRE